MLPDVIVDVIVIVIVVLDGALDVSSTVVVDAPSPVDVIDKGGAQVHGAVDVNDQDNDHDHDHVYDHAKRSSRLW